MRWVATTLCLLLQPLFVLAAANCGSDTDGQTIQLAYVASFDLQAVTPNIHVFIDGASEFAPYTSTDQRPKLFFPLLPVRAGDDTTYGNRLALCAMDSDTVHYNTTAGSFISCLSSSYQQLLQTGYVSTSDGGCNAEHNVSEVAEKITCYEQFAGSFAGDLYHTDVPQKCATANNLHLTELKQCAESSDGLNKQKTNTAACKEFLEDQYDKLSGKSSGAVGGLKSASSFVRRSEPQVIDSSSDSVRQPSSRRFNMNSLDFFGHKHHGPDKAEAQADAWIVAQPLYTVGTDGHQIVPQCRFNRSGFVLYTCAALQKQADENNIKEEDIWAWVAGMAVGFSVILAAIGVAILHRHEKKWHKPDAFLRPPITGENPFKFIQLDKDGNLDQQYEATVKPEPLKWLVGVAGSHLKDSYKTSAVCDM